MGSDVENPNISVIKRDLAAGRISRREFVRYASLIGMAVSAASALVGHPFGAIVPAARAEDMPKGGTLRLGTRVKSLANPATYSWSTYDAEMTRQVCEYLTLTDSNNVTHPYLLEKWDATPISRPGHFMSGRTSNGTTVKTSLPMMSCGISSG